MPDDSKDDRELVNTLKMLVGGALAGAAFQGVRKLLEPLSTIPEYFIGVLLGVILFTGMVYATASYFRFIERKVPTPLVRLSKEEKDEIANRVVERLEEDDYG